MLIATVAFVAISLGTVARSLFAMIVEAAGHPALSTFMQVTRIETIGAKTSSMAISA
jgi:hypothetical protein